ncbi:MAG: adenylate/guanylate cyclase domain-containing protein, partial [Planctomycetota bacterium]
MLHLSLCDDRSSDHSGEDHVLSVDQCVQCGRRQSRDEPPSPNMVETDAQTIQVNEEEAWEITHRFLIGDSSARTIPRAWFAVRESQQGVVLFNQHAALPVTLDGGDRVNPGQLRSLGARVIVQISDDLRLSISSDEASLDENDAEQAKGRGTSVAETPFVTRTLDAPPVTSSDAHVQLQATLAHLGPTGPQRDFGALLQVLLRVVRSTSSSDEFLEAAARAATEILQLDRASVLTPDEAPLSVGKDHAATLDEALDPVGQNPPATSAHGAAPTGWNIETQFIRDEPDSDLDCPPISAALLNQSRVDCRTHFHDSEETIDPTRSMMNLHCAVASPIMDTDRRVLGVLYGDRFRSFSANRHASRSKPATHISDVEGIFIELLAGSIAGGLRRQHQERMRTTLAGYFSPRVANHLARAPDLLKGRDAEVSVMFVDVRGFSRITETLGAAVAIEWINDVLTELSSCVVQRDGVLIDYVGDELMAMWGAPEKQDDHAVRALETTLQMRQKIRMMQGRWADKIATPFSVGIGVSTGRAHVGNVGSQIKFKYGALGNVVNTGSRLQAATQQLGVDCLASASTILSA